MADNADNKPEGKSSSELFTFEITGPEFDNAAKFKVDKNVQFDFTSLGYRVVQKHSELVTHILLNVQTLTHNITTLGCYETTYNKNPFKQLSLLEKTS